MFSSLRFIRRAFLVQSEWRGRLRKKKNDATVDSDRTTTTFLNLFKPYRSHANWGSLHNHHIRHVFVFTVLIFFSLISLKMRDADRAALPNRAHNLSARRDSWRSDRAEITPHRLWFSFTKTFQKVPKLSLLWVGRSVYMFTSWNVYTGENFDVIWFKYRHWYPQRPQLMNAMCSTRRSPLDGSVLLISLCLGISLCSSVEF